MAIFNVTGLDEAIKQLDLAADALKERAPEAAVAGGKVAAAAFQRSAPVRTGQLAASMTVDGPHHTVADGYYCDVYPSGKRADGERNATVGYVLEYGRSNMPAQPWMRPAMEESADEISSVIAEVLTGGGT